METDSNIKLSVTAAVHVSLTAVLYWVEIKLSSLLELCYLSEYTQLSWFFTYPPPQNTHTHAHTKVLEVTC